MQIVIDIDEELYEANNRGLKADELWDLRVAIKNGISLPKGHGKLIDKNLITNEIEQAYENSLPEPFAKLFVDFMAYIDDAPTIIEADTESEG